MIRFQLNGENIDLDVDPSTPLLWVLRDHLQMTGTKFGCGASYCGACTVHIDGRAMRSCVTPLQLVADKTVTTIEGIAPDHPVKQAWQTVDVPQCGYCQPGQIMSATALLANNPNPNDADIDRAMAGNICRCGTYGRIRRAIHQAANFYDAMEVSQGEKS